MDQPQYTLGYGGGAVCGDQVTITCHVEEKSTAALTTQGSTKVGSTMPSALKPRPWTLKPAFICVLSPQETRLRASMVPGPFAEYYVHVHKSSAHPNLLHCVEFPRRRSHDGGIGSRYAWHTTLS